MDDEWTEWPSLCWWYLWKYVLFAVAVLEARKLKKMDITGASDPYVKLKLFDSKQKRIGKKKKTSVKSCNLNPYWNESFVFIIDEMDMKRVTLDITVGCKVICCLFIWPSLLLGVWLRLDWRRRPHWKDQAWLEPEQGVQAWVQALEGSPGESQEANYQVARAAGNQSNITHFLLTFQPSGLLSLNFRNFTQRFVTLPRQLLTCTYSNTGLLCK